MTISIRPLTPFAVAAALTATLALPGPIRAQAVTTATPATPAEPATPAQPPRLHAQPERVRDQHRVHQVERRRLRQAFRQRAQALRREFQQRRHALREEFQQRLRTLREQVRQGHGPGPRSER